LRPEPTVGRRRYTDPSSTNVADARHPQNVFVTTAVVVEVVEFAFVAIDHLNSRQRLLSLFLVVVVVVVAIVAVVVVSILVYTVLVGTVPISTVVITGAKLPLNLLHQSFGCWTNGSDGTHCRLRRCRRLWTTGTVVVVAQGRYR
jgi:presenilin-like A22 family membrane protease